MNITRRIKFQNAFLGSIDDYVSADIVLVGVPMDHTVSYRGGTRFGPQKIRDVSYSIEDYSPYLDLNLDKVRYFDCGDLELPFGNVQQSLDIIGAAAKDIIADGKRVLFIGGEHLISLPVIRQIYERYGDDLRVVHFDAHADLRDEFFGQKFSHATVIRRVTDFLCPGHIYQFGIRSGIREEFFYAQRYMHIFKFEVLESLKRCLYDLKDWPIYVTLDIDVVDPAYANGTGTPEPGGCTASEIIEAIHVMRGLNVVGFDLVEVSPDYDPSNRTAILAAKIIREALLALFKEE